MLIKEQRPITVTAKLYEEGQKVMVVRIKDLKGCPNMEFSGRDRSSLLRGAGYRLGLRMASVPPHDRDFIERFIEKKGGDPDVEFPMLIRIKKKRRWQKRRPQPNQRNRATPDGAGGATSVPQEVLQPRNRHLPSRKSSFPNRYRPQRHSITCPEEPPPPESAHTLPVTSEAVPIHAGHLPTPPQTTPLTDIKTTGIHAGHQEQPATIPLPGSAVARAREKRRSVPPKPEIRVPQVMSRKELSILIIAPDDDERNMLISSLKLDGYKTLTILDRLEQIAVKGAGKIFHVAIVHQDSDGLEAVERMRRAATLKHLPVFFLVPHLDMRTKIALKSHGLDHVAATDDLEFDSKIKDELQILFPTGTS